MGLRASRESQQGLLHSPNDVASAPCKDDAEPFWLLILDPPQQQLELSETNRYSWPGATAKEQQVVYRRMWRLLREGGLAHRLMDVLRQEADDKLPLFLAGCVPYNYYLTHRFGAPAPIPTSDIDMKVDFGTLLRERLAVHPAAPTTSDRTRWSESETAAFQACYNEAIASFVAYAKRLLERLRVVLVEALPAIEREFAPQRIEVPAGGIRIMHKTHAAAQGNKPPLHLVPLSGGVFQLTVELTAPGRGRGDRAPETFFWNVIDVEADWKTASAGGAPAPVEVAVDDPALPEHRLRMLSADAIRADLNNKFQVVKRRRRELKRAYWDWAVKWQEEYNGCDFVSGRG